MGLVLCLGLPDILPGEEPSEKWNAQNVGAVSLPGSGLYGDKNDSFTIQAAGIDIWDKHDSFFYLYKNLNGDGRLQVRITSLGNTNPWAKAGLMVRQNLNDGSKNAFIGLTPSNGITFQKRMTSGGVTTNTTQTGSGMVWLRIERRSGKVYTYSSTNGQKWTLQSSVDLGLTGQVCIGLAVTSHNKKAKTLAIFDHPVLNTGLERLAAPWKHDCVGNPALTGLVAVEGDGFGMNAAGIDIWGVKDQMEYLHRPLIGDGSIVAKFTIEEGVEKWAKSGLMFRSSLDPDAANVFLAVTRGNGIIFQKRTAKGAVSTSIPGPAWNGKPLWLKLERTSATIIASASQDGEVWSLVGTQTLQLPSTCFAGIAATSHSPKVYSQTLVEAVNVEQWESAGSTRLLPVPWQSGDVGSTAVVGFAGLQQSSEDFLVGGSGADIWGTYDSFHFVRQILTGDGEITGRFNQLQNADGWTKFGLMARESLAPNAKNIFFAVTPSDKIQLQFRGTSGGNTAFIEPTSGTTPHWFRIRRKGNLFEAWRSLDNESWTFVNAVTIEMPEDAFVGVALTSHNNTRLALGSVGSISVSTISEQSPPQDAVPLPWIGSGIGATAFAGTSVFNSTTQSFEIYGGGIDIWNKKDQCYYLYQNLPADGELVARLNSVEYANDLTKAGLMIRSSLNEGSRNAALLVTANNLLHWQGRTQDEALTIDSTKGSPAFPVWLKIKRQGENVEMFYSDNGATWTSAGQSLLSGPALIGLTVTSHTPSRLARAVFDNVLFIPAPEDMDTDDDGMSNEWEIQYGFDPHEKIDAGIDTDGDAKSNLDEYLSGTDPLDYYNGTAPVLEITGGNSQLGEGGTYLTEPFSLTVKNSSGSATLPNAPVTFVVENGSQALSTGKMENPDLRSVITVRADAFGKITNAVYGFLPVAASSQLVVQAYPGFKTTSSRTPAIFRAYNYDPFNPPEDPTDQVVDYLPDGKLYLSWTDNSDNEEGFVVEKSSDGGQTWGSIANVRANQTAYTSGTGQDPADLLRVKSVNTAGVSDSERPKLELEIICEAAVSSAIEPFGLNDKGVVLLKVGGGVAVWDSTRSTDKLRYPPFPLQPPHGSGPHIFFGPKSIKIVGMGLEDAYCMRQDSVSLSAGGVTAYATASKGYRLNLETLAWTAVANTENGLSSRIEVNTSSSGADGAGDGEDSEEPVIDVVPASKTYIGMTPDGTLVAPGGEEYSDYGGFNNSGAKTASYTTGTGSNKVVTPVLLLGGGRLTIPAVGLLNEQAWVAGTVTTDQPASSTAFIWTRQSGKTTLSDAGWARSVNDLGWVCGYVGDAKRMDPRNPAIATRGTVWIPKIGSNGTPETYKAYYLDDCIKKTPNESWTITRGFQVNNQRDVLAYAVKSGKNYLVMLKGNGTSLNVDGNRDGTIQINSAEDKTERSRPFRFWVNDDDDEDFDHENVPVYIPDNESISIDGQKDLEDYSRLHFNLGNMVKEIVDGNIEVHIEWKTATGNPAIWLNRAVDTKGLATYLTEGASAGAQSAKEAGIELGNIVPNRPLKISRKTFESLTSSNPNAYFIFDGADKGRGLLILTFWKGNRKIGESSGVWLDLVNVRTMYRRAKITGISENFQRPSETKEGVPPEPVIGWEEDPNGNSYNGSSFSWEEAKQYIVFVHGWNMSYEESENYGETMFKRLWQRGYKGRYWFVRWATLDDTIVGIPYTYNDSEYRAWKSGEGVKQLLNSLPKEYSRNLVAHSMGNIVCGSAMQKGALVQNYAMLNAAVPAACYDDSETLYYENTFRTPHFDKNEDNRNLSYRYKLNNVNTNLINFHLSGDSALRVWESNNNTFKPQMNTLGGYYYAGDYKDDWKLGVDFVLSRRLVTTPHEAMSYIAYSPTKAIGALGDANGSIDRKVDMNNFEFQSIHSAEFIFNIQRTSSFYEELMKSFQIQSY